MRGMASGGGHFEHWKLLFGEAMILYALKKGMSSKTRVSAKMGITHLKWEQAGHTVVTTIDQPQLAAACAKHRFDVALIEQAIDPRMRKIVASLIREQCPAAKILELYPPDEARVVADADAWLEARQDVPKDLVERVNELLQE